MFLWVISNHECLLSGADVAIWLVRKDDRLADEKDDNECTSLQLLSKMPFVFWSHFHLGPVEFLIYHCISLPPLLYTLFFVVALNYLSIIWKFIDNICPRAYTFNPMMGQALKLINPFVVINLSDSSSGVWLRRFRWWKRTSSHKAGKFRK